MRRLVVVLVSGLVSVIALVGVVLAVTVVGPAARQPGPEPRDGGARGSIVALQAHLEDQPKDAMSWASLGQLYVEQARITADPGFYPKAEGAFAESLRLAPDGNDLALAGHAALAAARHDFRAALEFSDAALAVDPYDSAALSSRTDALTELGRYDDALAAAELADSTTPSVVTFTRLAYQYELRGDLATARSLFERSLSGRPTPQDVAFARHRLAEIARTLGDLDAAELELSLALDADPQHLPSLAAQARLATSRGDTELALVTWETVVGRAPLPGNLLEYGELLESLGREAEASQQYAAVQATYAIAGANGVSTDLEQALFEADHGDPLSALAAAESDWAARQSIHAADAMAWALHVNGRDVEAVAYADRALALGTPDPRFHYHRGVIRAAVGDSAGARADLSISLSIDPSFSPLDAPAARQLLTSLGGPS